MGEGGRREGEGRISPLSTAVSNREWEDLREYLDYDNKRRSEKCH